MTDLGWLISLAIRTTVSTWKQLERPRAVSRISRTRLFGNNPYGSASLEEPREKTLIDNKEKLLLQWVII